MRALVVFAALAVAPAAHARDVRCEPSPRRPVVAKSRFVRVVRVHSGTYVACARRRNAQLVVLGSNDRGEHTFEAIRHILVAGRFVAAEQEFDDAGYVDRSVWVWDVWRRRVRWHIPTGVSAACTSWYGTGRVSDLVLRPTGAVAWITRHSRCSQAPGLEVHRADRRGTTLLMTDPAVQPGSLALDGITISWTVGSSRESSDLR